MTQITGSLPTPPLTNVRYLVEVIWASVALESRLILSHFVLHDYAIKAQWMIKRGLYKGVIFTTTISGNHLEQEKIDRFEWVHFIKQVVADRKADKRLWLDLFIVKGTLESPIVEISNSQSAEQGDQVDCPMCGGSMELLVNPDDDMCLDCRYSFDGD